MSALLQATAIDFDAMKNICNEKNEETRRVKFLGNLKELKTIFLAKIEEQVNLSVELGSLFLSQYHQAKHSVNLSNLKNKINRNVDDARKLDIKNKCKTSVETVVESYELLDKEYYGLSEQFLFLPKSHFHPEEEPTDSNNDGYLAYFFSFFYETPSNDRVDEVAKEKANEQRLAEKRKEYDRKSICENIWIDVELNNEDLRESLNRVVELEAKYIAKTPYSSKFDASDHKKNFRGLVNHIPLDLDQCEEFADGLHEYRHSMEEEQMEGCFYRRLKPPTVLLMTTKLVKRFEKEYELATKEQLNLFWAKPANNRQPITDNCIDKAVAKVNVSAHEENDLAGFVSQLNECAVNGVKNCSTVN